jgi:hypothetical protein
MNNHGFISNGFGYGHPPFIQMNKRENKKSKKSSRINESETKIPHILPSIIKVGGDSNSNLNSAVKSSTTFLSSQLGRRRKSKSKKKKSDRENNSSIKI